MSLHLDRKQLPVFPLHAVVFVGGTLQLQIFEQRYLQLVKNCMKQQHGFISVLIRDGREVDDTPETYEVGTYVEIIDWNALDNNLLGITVRGLQRVQLRQRHVDENKLIHADIDFIDNLICEHPDIPDEDLLQLLQTLQQHEFVQRKYPELDFTSSLDIAYKLCELLPASAAEKQQLLESNRLSALLKQLRTVIHRLENSSA